MVNKASRQTTCVCGIEETNRKDEMPHPCIFTSDFYSVSDPFKPKFQQQMLKGWKRNHREEEQPLGYIGTIFFIALSDLNNSLSKKKVCVVIVLFFPSLSFFFKL